MAGKTVQSWSAAAWALAERQHGVVARRQLLALGLGAKAIEHRLATGRLHPIRRGVYAVGRRSLTREGRWMAAVLSCGPRAWLSHGSAAALWGIGQEEETEVSVDADRAPTRASVRVHRRADLSLTDLTVERNIPVTGLVRTLVDLAVDLDTSDLEAAVNAADRRELIDPEELRSALAHLAGQPGVAILRRLLDRRTFTLTDSELERRFLPLARRAGLPRPRTQAWLNGFRVDFHWPDLELVVETDGLRYHRTPAQQTRDRVRDQAHTAAGLTHLRFTHAQVRYEPRYVEATLARVARRLAPPRAA
jgi:very-short-patch-repair endonuclease